MCCKKRWSYVTGGIILCMMLLFNTWKVEAAGTKTVVGTCEYDSAYEVLEILNNERSKIGAGELTMDKELLLAAMLRAAECTVLFDHTRPNGSLCFEASDKMYAENIAYGYGNASAVMNGWMSSKGHKMNILNSEYSSVGIGCFYVNGTRYWVQCFGIETADVIKQPKNCTNTYKVSLTSGVETVLVNSESGTDHSKDSNDTKDANPLKTKISDFKVTEGKRKLTLKWKKKSGIDGYQLQIATSKSFKNKQSYTISKNTTKKVIKKYKGAKLKAKKKYYIRIRAYIQSIDSDGKTIKQYSKWNTVNKKTK